MSKQDRYELCARDLFARVREDFGDEVIIRGKKYKFEKITESDINEFTDILLRHFPEPKPVDEKRIEKIAKYYGLRAFHCGLKDCVIEIVEKALRELIGGE